MNELAFRIGAVLAVALLPLWPASLSAQDRPPGAEREGPVFTFHRVHDDVYLAVGTGNLTVMSNAAIVINDEDVLVVDSHVSPAAAHALLEELAEITPKPVRYVVNTHYHFDHAHGNQVYPSTVEIIGHEFTREALESGRSLAGRSEARFLAPLPQRVAALRAQLDTATTLEARAELQRRLLIQENFLAATNAVVPTPPTITLDRRLTLFRGDREIQLLFFGRGHTGGDIVVYLPEERIVVTGDLLPAGLPYMGDAYLPEWIETLEQVKALDFDLVLPGHGMPFGDRERIDRLQAYMADLWAQIVALHGAGVPAQEAARRIDLRSHREHYSAAANLGADIDAVDRAYELLDGGP